MFRKFDLVVGICKKVVGKAITNPSKYGQNAWSVRFMKVVEAFVNPNGIIKNS